MNGITQVSGPGHVIPAYGRVYSSKDEALSEWAAGKDFKLTKGPYCSIRDIENLRWDYSTFWILWNRVDAVRIF